MGGDLRRLILSHREKIFWLCVGAILLVGFVSLIPGQYNVCDTDHQTHKEYCTGYRLTPFILIQVYKFFHSIEGIITALATFAVPWFTWTIWQVNAGQLAHDKQVDRAYMSGGGNRNSVTAGLSPEGDPIMRPGDRFIFRVNNYGKTEGTLYKLSYGFCDEDDIPPEPIYTKQYRRSQIDPGRSGQPIADHPIPAEHKKPVVYGRFHYKTIFGSYHSSGFIYRIIASEDSVPIRPPSDAYIEDRTETPDDDDA